MNKTIKEYFRDFFGQDKFFDSGLDYNDMMDWIGAFTDHNTSQNWLEADSSTLESIYRIMIANQQHATPVPKQEEECICGANYTSNPKFHLRYCSLSRKVS